MHINAKAIKVNILLDPAAFAEVEVTEGVPRFLLTIAVAGRTLHADLSAKSVRKVVAAIRLHSADAVALILQGKLAPGDKVEEAGLSAQLRSPKPVEAEEAAA